MESNKLNLDGQLLYIEPKWITGETCLFNIKDSITYAIAKSKLSKIRQDFISRLDNDGFVITYDKNIKDTIYFIMDESAICYKEVDINIYKKMFDKKIFEAGGDKLNYPKSLTMEEFFKNPFFPAVLKNELMNGGVDKFLIETPEQLEIIKKFYNDFSSNNEYVQQLNCSIFQQLIENPTRYKTYMRVLMSASGDVMGASLKYSNINEQKRNPKGLLEKYFWDKNSKYYLNCKGMFNYYSNGGNISFSQPRYSDEKKAILKEHSIDPNNPRIPDEVLEVSSLIAQNCNRELGIMCGIDFIFNELDKKWYYLEIQAFPAIEEWANTKNIKPIKVNNADDYVKYCALELEARYDALMLYMKKKSYSNIEEEPKIYQLRLK